MSILLLNPAPIFPQGPDSRALSLTSAPLLEECPTPPSRRRPGSKKAQAFLKVAQGTGVGSESAGH